MIYVNIDDVNRILKDLHEKSLNKKQFNISAEIEVYIDNLDSEDLDIDIREFED